MHFNVSYFKKVNGVYKFFEKVVEFDHTPTANEVAKHEGDGLYHTIKVEVAKEIIKEKIAEEVKHVESKFNFRKPEPVVAPEPTPAPEPEVTPEPEAPVTEEPLVTDTPAE